MTDINSSKSHKNYSMNENYSDTTGWWLTNVFSSIQGLKTCPEALGEVHINSLNVLGVHIYPAQNMGPELHVEQ